MEKNSQRKNIYDRFLSSYYTQLIAITIIILFLLMISIVFINDTNATNFDYNTMDLVYMLFYNIIIGGAVFGYSCSKNTLSIELSMGYTRGEIYSSFVKRIVRVLLFSLLIAIYTIYVNKMVLNSNDNIYDLLKQQGLFSMITLFVFISFVSFLVGLFRLNDLIALIIWVVLAIGLYFVMKTGIIGEMINSVLIIITIILAFVCRKIIDDIEVRNRK